MLIVAVIFLIIAENAEIGYAQNFVNPFIINNIPEDQVLFYLYNRKNVINPIRLESENLYDVDVSKETKFIIHGFFENSRNLWYKNITIEYLEKGDYNVIQVDWSKPASNTYTISSWNTQGVGRLIGKLITRLYNKRNLSLSKVHIIGHSLGSHVASYAGKEVIKRTGSGVFRITALDAAGPLFEGPLLMFDGLGKDDAIIVDAIHTDGGMFGRSNVMADVDFFPNGGIAPQPGCDLVRLLLPPNDFEDFRQEVFCSHMKSYAYFIASINQVNFTASKCTSWRDYQQGNCNDEPTAIMGENYVYSDSTVGTFYLKTTAFAPYAKN